MIIKQINVPQNPFITPQIIKLLYYMFTSSLQREHCRDSPYQILQYFYYFDLKSIRTTFHSNYLSRDKIFGMYSLLFYKYVYIILVRRHWSNMLHTCLLNPYSVTTWNGHLSWKNCKSFKFHNIVVQNA